MYLIIQKAIMYLSKINLIFIIFIFGCSPDEKMDIPSSTSEQSTTSNSDNNLTNNTNSSVSGSDSVINQNFECGNGYYYLSRPEPSEIDDTHEYFEYEWQSAPPVCVNIYQSELLGGRDEKLKVMPTHGEIGLMEEVYTEDIYIKVQI